MNLQPLYCWRESADPAVPVWLLIAGQPVQSIGDILEANARIDAVLQPPSPARRWRAQTKLPAYHASLEAARHLTITTDAS